MGTNSDSSSRLKQEIKGDRRGDAGGGEKKEIQFFLPVFSFLLLSIPSGDRKRDCGILSADAVAAFSEEGDQEERKLLKLIPPRPFAVDRSTTVSCVPSPLSFGSSTDRLSLINLTSGYMSSAASSISRFSPISKPREL